jgi:hypothetical protein
MKAVLGARFTDRSGWKIAVYFITLLLLIVASSLIRASHSAIGETIALEVLAFVVLVTVATALLIRIRFPT